jgi:hypothetical protein
MTTVTLNLDDDLNAALEAFSSEQGRDKAALLADVVRQFVETERLRQELRDPMMAALLEELASEEVALAEQGLADYQRLLGETGRS